MPGIKFEYIGEDYPQLKDRVFEGPPVLNGYIPCWRTSELKWVKAQLGIQNIDSLDIIEMQAVYFGLTIRTADHSLLPSFRKFYEDVRGDDFREVKDDPEPDEVAGVDGETPDPTEPDAPASETSSS